MSKLNDFGRYPSASPLAIGTCAGLAYQLNMPTWLVRLVFVMLVLGTKLGFGFIYLLGWILIPAKVLPKDYVERTGDGG